MYCHGHCCCYFIFLKPKMRLRDVYNIISDNVSTHAWLRRKCFIGDFTDEDCGKCDQERLRLVRDTYKSDGHCWRCNNKSCNGKVSIRQGSWFDHSKLTMGLNYFINWTAESLCKGHQVDLGTAFSVPNIHKLLVRLMSLYDLQQQCTRALPPSCHHWR